MTLHVHRGQLVDYKVVKLSLLWLSVILVQSGNNPNSCAGVYKQEHTHAYQLRYGQQTCIYIPRATPTRPRHPKVVFPTLPQGCESGHLYSKSTLLCGKKHGRTHAHKTLCHLGLTPPPTRHHHHHHPHLEQLWLKLSCVAVGRRWNAGQTALRAPTEGKL